MNYSRDDLKALFQAKFDYTKWFVLLKDFFKADELRTTAEAISDPADYDKGYYIGAINTSDSYRIGLFYYEIGHSNVARKKVGLRNLVRTFINPNWGQFDAALAVFSDAEHWRLSLISDIKGEATAAKRYTFVFGEKDNLYRTAIERFAIIRSEGPSFESLKKAFSVEALTEEFFGLYKDHYERFCDFIYQNADDRRYFGPEFAQWNSKKDSQKYIRDYVKNLMGRIVFLQFLQKKGWMGVPTDRNDWTGGDPYFMQHLYDYATEEQKEDFLDEVLEPLFFNCLNVLRPNDVFDTNVKGIGTVKVPYLNGELFEQKEVDKAQSRFPKKYFHDLLNLFLQYNFTIDENDPNDAEIGVDPEMLGKIFENLLEDNKDKGVFYTPKEIVRYMCKESLIAYLCTNNGAKHADSIKTLVNNHQLTSKLQEDVKTCERLNKHLRNVKVCDPAIGSGAFPMGLMNEIFACRSVLHGNIEETDEETSGQIKREIIQNNIYGVDIEQGAVDIARLRFWLALVVDSVKPEPLPNLDYKIMQGNSLVESYKGLDLSNLLHSDNLFVATKADELGKYMKSYFRATDNEEKRLLREKIDFAVKQCISLSGIYDTISLPNTKFFLWHTYFHDVFKEGGFDIVIGNPPWGADLSKQAKQTLKVLYPEIDSSTPNSYAYFIGLALRLSTSSVSLVLPDSILIKDFKKVRKLMLPYLTEIIWYENTGIPFAMRQFKDVDHDVCIISMRNKESADVNRVCYTYDSSKGKLVKRESLDKKNDVFLCEFDFVYNMRASQDDLHILEKLLAMAPMKDFMQCHEGIHTGNVREKLFIYHYKPEYKELFYGGRAGDIIRPYYGKRSGWYVNYNESIINKQNGEYASLRDERIFMYPKIYITRTGNPFKAFYDDNTYASNNFFSLQYLDYSINNRDNLMLILSLINSRLCQYFIRMFAAPRLGTAFVETKIIHLLKFPIPRAIDEKIKERIVTIVEGIIVAKMENLDACTEENEIEIDRLVYHLYGLSYDEVKIIDPETLITKEEYEAQ